MRYFCGRFSTDEHGNSVQINKLLLEQHHTLNLDSQIWRLSNKLHTAHYTWRRTIKEGPNADGCRLVKLEPTDLTFIYSAI